MSYISYDNFGRSELYINISWNDKLKVETINEIYNSQQDHPTQMKKMPKRLKKSNGRRNSLKKN